MTSVTIVNWPRADMYMYILHNIEPLDTGHILWLWSEGCAAGHIFTNVFLTDWFAWYWTRLCFRVGALGEFIAFAFELFACRWMQSNCVFEQAVTGWIHYSLFWICFQANLAVAGYNLIDCVFERSSSSAETFSVYFRGIKGRDILATCVLCLYLYWSTFQMCLRGEMKKGPVENLIHLIAIKLQKRNSQHWNVKGIIFSYMHALLPVTWTLIYYCSLLNFFFCLFFFCR